MNLKPEVNNEKESQLCKKVMATQMEGRKANMNDNFYDSHRPLETNPWTPNLDTQHFFPLSVYLSVVCPIIFVVNDVGQRIYTRPSLFSSRRPACPFIFLSLRCWSIHEHVHLSLAFLSALSYFSHLQWGRRIRSRPPSLYCVGETRWSGRN